jgi:hypothetical protein
MVDGLIQDIKQNCDISDAGYWGYFSICGLLMRYRDLFRSEQGLDPWSPIAREKIAAWIERKESRWQELEGLRFRNLSIGETTFHPFDTVGINSALAEHGLVYGAGYGMYLKPTFFLAQLRSRTESSGHTIYRTGQELVRDLFTAPAMLQGTLIFLRLETLKSYLWDQYSQLRPGLTSVLADAFTAYGLRPGQSFHGGFPTSFDSMLSDYAEVLLRHELAESRESVPPWKSIVAAASDRKSEHFLRAVQDLIADTSDAGPLAHVVGARDRHGLALFIGLMEGYRRSLYPELRDAYLRFNNAGDWSIIDAVRRCGFTRFVSVREAILALFVRGDRDSFLAGLRELIQERAEQ